MGYFAGEYDVAVVGAGHAGIEAALAAARLGMKTILFSISLDAVANLPCNPSIGGTAKGHLVREIDALGGEMGKAADATFLQSRMLNRGKGPAVHSLRVQTDRVLYRLYMKRALEEQENLELRQAEIISLSAEDGRITGLVTRMGGEYRAKTVILSTGTYLNGRIYIGEHNYTSGPDGLHASLLLGESIRAMGIGLRRFKTGTPARAHRRSIDFTQLEEQRGENPVIPFSFENRDIGPNQLSCHIAYTNGETHRVIRENLHRSPLYGGLIEGIGPRYCPSIEDKVVRFADKERHQIFVEPMGLDTQEVYLQGMSSSLPEDVQIAFLRTIKGFERIEIMRSAYAIEYDCIDPTGLSPSLEFKSLKGLFGAGQFNGTSGYEEAAAQGLVAGINAARQVRGVPPITLTRQSSYIGTLIDDLVIKGCMDPYRMMTSRSEFRLLLRQDNADIRLTPLGREIGLITDSRWEAFQRKQDQIGEETRRLEGLVFSPTAELNEVLVSHGTTPVTTGVRAIELLKRPQISYSALGSFDHERPELDWAVAEQVEIQIKYEGYIRKQLAAVEEMTRLEQTPISKSLDYSSIGGLRLEAREKLAKIQPENLGQASRISGVSPADIGVISVYLKAQGRCE